MSYNNIQTSDQIKHPLRTDGPIRVLHAVEDMNSGGLEAWLMQVMHHVDRERFHFDFLLTGPKPGVYDQKIQNLGGSLISCPFPHRPWQWGKQFKEILCQYGPYHVVHSHLHYFSGYVLRLAKQAGVPVRIAHSHTAPRNQGGLVRRMYLSLMKTWIFQYSTLGLGCSHTAIKDLFVDELRRTLQHHTLYCGVDLAPFQESISSSEVRKEHNLPNDAFVIGHVGRFEQVKNHEFILDIFSEVAKSEPRAYLLLIGDGSLKTQVENRVFEIGLANKVIFAGYRSDISKQMRGAMDIFLFPSLYEGLPLVLIEAQAAGIPCAISDVIPEEVDVVSPLLKRLSLGQPASVWAREILAWFPKVPKEFSEMSLSLISDSPFNILSSTHQLEKIYENQLLENYDDDTESSCLKN